MTAGRAGSSPGGTLRRVDARDFLKTVLDPERLAVVGAVAARPGSADALAERTGVAARDVLATLAPLVQAGVVDRDGDAYRLRPEALRELAQDLPQPRRRRPRCCTA